MKNKTNQIAKTTFRSLVSAIPYIGGAIIEATWEHHNRVKSERITNFVEQLKAYFEDIDKSKVDKDFIESNRFTDIFEEVINTVSKTDDEKKVERLKQILSGSIAPDANVNRFENFIDLIRRLSDDQILILERFARNKSKSEKVRSKISTLEIELTDSVNNLTDLKEKAKLGTINSNESIGKAMKTSDTIEFELVTLKNEYKELTQFIRSDFENLTEDEAEYLIEDLISKRLLLNVKQNQLGNHENTFGEISISIIGDQFIKYLKSN